MNFLDLFSGIGGFRLGAEWAGMKFEHEFHSDIGNLSELSKNVLNNVTMRDIENQFVNKVYAKHFPNSIQLGDVAKINGHELKEKYGREWIITGGFPCQDISIAGKGAGLSGSRSGLWFEMQRIISELRPQYAIMENVPALTFRGLDRVLGSLADIGYDAEWTVISARDIGASHLRKRIWIVAYPNQERCGSGFSNREERSVLSNIHGDAEESEPEWERRFSRVGKISEVGEHTYPSKQQGSMRDSKPSESGQVQFGRAGGKNEFSNTMQNGFTTNQIERSSGEILQEEQNGSRDARQTGRSDCIPTPENNVPNTDEIRFRGRFTQEWGSSEDKINGVKDWSISQMVQAYHGHLQWQRTFEPEFVRVVDGIPNQLDRIGTCGNSIVPQIAELIFRLCEDKLH